MGFLSKLSLGLLGGGDEGPHGKEGARAYAVGDIHGRLDLLDRLIGRIEEDIAARPRRRNYVVFLGDLIDRGPDSAGVVERLRNYRPSYAKPIFLAGNHEEVLLRMLAGDKSAVSPTRARKIGSKSPLIRPSKYRPREERACVRERRW